MGFVYINTFDSIRQYDESHLIGDQNEAMVTNNTGHLFIDDPLNPEHTQAIKDLTGVIKLGAGAKNTTISNCSIIRTGAVLAN